ncbi:amidase [Legionella waltersii]|uniref:Amidase n=1 Tax=Legionella waltersii TaxID=66969 RepID=A0A0W1A5R8_9GAMM|nr:amidase [Legionella waltersii]KTD76355.1 amidase [Legionella waltersii]SNV13915.1 amidase [Legionella waltersii]
MLVDEYIRYDAHDLAHLIKSGKTSPQALLDCAKARIEQVNPLLNAVVLDCTDFAYDCLTRLTGKEPYYGVPMVVKDLGHGLKGLTTTDGSHFFSSHLATDTSDFIEKLMNLGFIPFAKTNTPELGLSYVTESTLLGPCRNPYDANRTAGGSSGGSAAAIAAGIAPIATASDGGGSIRIPASCCGLFGFKPTTGLIPSGPLVDELWSGLATNFLLSRSIRDSVEIYKRVVPDLPIHPNTQKKLMITEIEGAFSDVPVAQEYIEAVNSVKELLKSLGHKLTRSRLDLDLDAIGQSAMTLIAANTFAKVRGQELEIGRKPDQDELEPVTWEFYYRGKSISAYELIKAKNTLYQSLRPLHQLLEKIDLIVTPSLAQKPLLIGELRTDMEFNHYLKQNVQFSPFTSLFNQAGLPAMTIPVLLHENLPISIQLGSGKNKDLLLLSLAEQLQEKLPSFHSPLLAQG